MSPTMLRFLVASLGLSLAAATPLNTRDVAKRSTCRKTQVAVLGAGAAGITAAQALSNNNIKDFLILEYTDSIGGRCRPAPFGKNKQGKPYTIELGANWIQGLGQEGGPENPIWTLSKKYGVQNAYQEFSSIATFTEKGPVDYTQKLEELEATYTLVEQDAARIIKQNGQDRNMRDAYKTFGWDSAGDPQKQAMEWYFTDFEYAHPNERSSQVFTVLNYNSTYYGFSEENHLVFDQRGFNTFIKGQASEYLAKNDPRLLLNTIVKNIAWSDQGVTINNADGSCVEAQYAINTFSVGVLKSNEVTYSPALPAWKKAAIDTFQIGLYIKIFMQFPLDKVFWNSSVEANLYASPKRKGYYPLFAFLDHPKFLPGSGILVATVTTGEAERIEAQSDDITKKEILQVLREMYGKDAVPEPTSFFVSRWGNKPWARGSYSNWPPGLTLKGHQNLRANTGRLWYAGEATSAEYYGFLQGAHNEGKKVGETVAACLAANRKHCREGRRYEVLPTTIEPSAFTPENGWFNENYKLITT